MNPVEKSTAKSPGFVEKLRYLFRYYEASKMACGMIAIRCRHRGDPEWKELQEFLANQRPELAASFCYEENAKRLVILAEELTVAETHYLAIVIKEYLQRTEQLAGGVAVAAYPESGDAMEEILMGMTERLNQKPFQHAGIQVVLRPEEKWDRPPRLLLVESDPVIQQILSVRLAKNGYEIFQALDGKEGQQKILQVQPDLIITELTLPVMNGYQLIDWVQRQHEQTAACKIVVLTDRRLEEDMSHCFQKGVADFLTKPFSPVELDWRIKRLLIS